MQLKIKEFFDPATWTLTYIVTDEQTKDSIIIDPVWDYDQASSKVSTQSVEKVLSYIVQNKLKVHFILETHAHADHLSSAQVLKKRIPDVQIGIGENIVKVQTVFKKIFNLNSDFKTDGSQFDFLLQEGKTYSAGSLKINVLATPGHTPACSSYLIEDAVFTGDALFMPDYGTGRCDFPSGSAEALYASIQKLYQLPDTTRVFTGHDYMPEGRPLQFQSSIGEEKKKNIQIQSHTTKEEFVSFRTNRDKILAAPKLLLPSVQVNIDAGHLPAPDTNGTHYLKIPIG